MWPARLRAVIILTAKSGHIETLPIPSDWKPYGPKHWKKGRRQKIECMMAAGSVCSHDPL
jgi:hypothetical protein